MIVHKSGKDISFVGNFRRKLYRELSEKVLYRSLTNEWSNRYNPLYEFEEKKLAPQGSSSFLPHKRERREKVIEKLVKSTLSSIYSKDV